MYMRLVSDNIRFLFPAEPDMDLFLKQTATETFSDDAVAFLNTFSHELSKDIRTYPEIAALAFFCRKGNILGLKKKYKHDEDFRLGRGIVFHIAPSNVPLNFAYSLVCGILSGNCNIIRVPSKDFEQVQIVCEALNRVKLTGEHNFIADRILLTRYDRQDTATAYFSSVCDVRIIWGGDQTIEQVRKNPISARAFDITFADRFSLCVINADAYVKEVDHEKIAVGFYNDTYLYDQNACTSPHLMIWLGSGENVESAKEVFWGELHKIIIRKHYTIQPVIAVDKLTSYYAQASASGKISKTTTADNSIWRVKLEELLPDIDQHRCSSGYFSEYHAASLSELSGIINRSYQTVSYFGLTKKELGDFIMTAGVTGIDRVVPVGRTADFSLTWDGFELINTLSRSIEIIS
jgi:hypothetical protein